MKKVCVGGTFNAVHKGHISLLKKAFEVGDSVLVAITSDEMAQMDREVRVRSFEERKETVSEILDDIADGKEYIIAKIDDPYGPAIVMALDIIVTSEETRPTAVEINGIRSRNGLPVLEIISIPMVLNEKGEKISATSLIESSS